MMMIIIIILWDRYNHQRIDKKTGRLVKIWTGGDHPNYRIIKIGQNN